MRVNAMATFTMMGLFRLMNKAEFMFRITLARDMQKNVENSINIPNLVH